MKTERIARKVYQTRDQARADVFEYIEQFYNSLLRCEPCQPHPSAGGFKV